MATTSIWSGGNVKDLVKYITQKHKTTSEETILISGINVSLNPQEAIEQMEETKTRLGKKEGRQVYHAYQSFLPNEVTAKQAHKIGNELAQRMWGERFEVVVATHVDQEHIHNHFAVNSVSFVDGKKFLRMNEDYKKFRNLSDEICEREKLSVIENPKQKAKNYGEWQAEKSNQPTLRSSIRDDIDYAISQVSSVEELWFKLESWGYTLKLDRKYPAVAVPDSDRFVRLKSLDKSGNYLPDKLENRILEKRVVGRYKSQFNKNKGKRFKPKRKRKLTKFERYYYRMNFTLGWLKPYKPYTSYENRKKASQLSRQSEELRLLTRKNLNTSEEIQKEIDRIKTYKNTVSDETIIKRLNTEITILIRAKNRLKDTSYVRSKVEIRADNIKFYKSLSSQKERIEKNRNNFELEPTQAQIHLAKKLGVTNYEDMNRGEMSLALEEAGAEKSLFNKKNEKEEINEYRN